MQRLAGDFLVKRVVAIYGQGGATTELYELPNGQWQFGKGRDAVVVRSLDDVSMCDAGTQKDVAAWLDRTKNRPTPEPVQQGQTPMLAGETVKDRLSQAIAHMPDDAVARVLGAIEQVMGPIADSLKQAAETNHYSDGYGQDQGMHAPASVPFQLPEGARWVDQNRPESGYYTFNPEVTDERGHPTAKWNPTPEFHAMTTRPEPVPVVETTPLNVHVPQDDVAKEMSRERAKRGVPAGRRR